MKSLSLLFLLALLPAVTRASAPIPDSASSPAATTPWVPDLGNGSYKNPVLQADYSDPDATRVGDDFWLTSSSFTHVPGLPILHSRDLVNWTLVAHALPRLVPEDAFRTPQHGKGVWAPALRFHAGQFYLYYPDPDFGIYLLTATDPRGPWSAPVLVKGGRGLIDPCPLWDDDGRLYLIHGWAASRAKVANVLTLLELSPDGTKVIDDFGYVVNGARLPNYHTLEGPKLYKRDGWYYIFAPAGGVTGGWQTVFRSRSIRGPYESRIVLAQGSTPINGPHQGALVDTPGGQWWFLHFQDQGAYGRVVHLQPVVWRDGWPLMGTGVETGAVTGEPLLTHAKPDVPAQPIAVPATSDDFSAPSLSLQWQWEANPTPTWYSLTDRPGYLRLFGQPEPVPGNLYDAPNLLLQKFPAVTFSATTRLELSATSSGAGAGLIVFGMDYAWIGLQQRDGAPYLVLAVCHDAPKGRPQRETVAPVALPTTGASPGAILLRVTVTTGAHCQFSYSLDGTTFVPVGDPFVATPGRWVGAKLGLFATGSARADFDYFRVTPPLAAN